MCTTNTKKKGEIMKKGIKIPKRSPKNIKTDRDVEKVFIGIDKTIKNLLEQKNASTDVIAFVLDKVQFLKEDVSEILEETKGK